MPFRPSIFGLPAALPFRLGAAAVTSLGWAVAVHAAPAGAYVIAGNTSKLVQMAKTIGAADPLAVIDVTLWLKPHNKAEMDTLAHDLYDPRSPQYRHWLDRNRFAAEFAPTAQEARQVTDFALAHNLSVSLVDKYNFFVRVRGTVAAVQQAFSVTIDQFQFRGASFRANTGDPTIADPAGALIMSVGGLDSTGYTHPLVQQTAPVAGQSAIKARSTARASADAAAYTSACFKAPKSETISNLGSDPSGTYTGNSYVGAYDTHIAGCGYTPPEIQTAYNLNALYAEGYNGAGQTIVIVDWCGSPTILNDANAFSAAYGLPALSAANFSIINYPAPSSCASEDPEINIDVEWSHAIAPGANIVLLVPPSPNFDDIDSALLYAVENGVGNVISNSYGAEESEIPTAIIDTQNGILESAAILGIAANFSTGDSGDFTFDYPQYYQASVSNPADSPYVTAIGGISLGLTSSNAISFQAGWGTNVTLLADGGYVYNPPINFGFDFGSGGGPSAVYHQPSWQSAVRGHMRQLPDISWLADPYTGGVIAISEPGVSPAPVYTVYGGTSLACPMFSGLWAIADQEAGASLGQAAPYLYTMPASTITDVTPYGSKTNVTAKIAAAPGQFYKYSASDLAQPLENTNRFYSVVWNYPLEQDTAYLLTFGTDSGLVTSVGWDDVTGVGVPNGQAFADYFRAQ